MAVAIPIQKGLESFQAGFEHFLALSDTFKTLAQEMKDAQSQVQSRIESLGRDINGIQNRVQMRLSRYFELRGDLVLFQHSEQGVRRCS